MKVSEAVIRRWARLISDDYMHYSDEDFEYIVNMARYLDWYIFPGDAGVIGYTVLKDFDCKIKLNVLLFYCKREYRGRYLIKMFRTIEDIAKQEGAVKVIIGDSDSGYKEAKFNKALGYFGYSSSGHSKEI